MKTIWKMDVLQDLISFYGKGIVPQYVDQKNCDAIWVLNQKCNTNHKISYDKARYTDIKHKPVSQERYLRIGDIIINATGYGTAGRVAQVDNLIGDTTVDSHMIIIRANYNKVHPKYLAYYMKHNQATIESYAEGSTGQTEISKNRLCYEFKVGYPDLETQKKIAKVLSALDDKIELNNQINKNLEEQANALFDNMFPNISQGNRTVGDYIVPKRGKSLLSKDAVLGDVPVVAGGLEPSTYHNESNTTAPVITISASGANAGYVSLWHIPVWSSDSSYIDSKMSDSVYFWYILLKKRQKEIYDSQTGSAQPHIYPQHIAVLPLCELSIESTILFNMRVTSLFAQIANNKAENAILHKTRDTLLPKLMSGEIDIDNVEI